LETSITFEMDIADYRPSKPKRQGQDRETDWIAPQHSFVLSKYLNAEQDWGELSTPERKKTGRGKHSLQKLTSRLSTPSTPHRKSPEEVQPVLPPAKKKYRVPAAPEGVTFFRTTSKHAIAEGDMLSESDDDLDEDWLVRMQQEGYRDDDRAHVVIDMLTQLDDHMRREGISADIHVGDSLVRFIRLHIDVSTPEGVKIAFRQKVQELRKDEIIDNQIYKHCVSVLDVPHHISVAEPPRDALTNGTTEKAASVLNNGTGNGQHTNNNTRSPSRISDKNMEYMSLEQLDVLLSLSPKGEEAMWHEHLTGYRDKHESRLARLKKQRTASGKFRKLKKIQQKEAVSRPSTPLANSISAANDGDNDVVMVDAPPPASVERQDSAVTNSAVSTGVKKGHSGGCLCGKGVVGMRGTILCAKMVSLVSRGVDIIDNAIRRAVCNQSFTWSVLD